MNTETAPRPPPPPLILSLTSSSTTTAVSPASTSTTAPKAANANANNGDGTSLSEALAHSVADYVCAKTQQHQKNTSAGQQGGGVSSKTQQPCPSNIVTKGQQRQGSSPSSSCIAHLYRSATASATAPEETAATVVKATTTTATTATTAISVPPAAEAAKTPSPSKALPSAETSNQCERSPGEQAALPSAQPIAAAVAATQPSTPPNPATVAASSTSPSTPRIAPPTSNTSTAPTASEPAPTPSATPLITPNAATINNSSSPAGHSSPGQILKSPPTRTSTATPSSHSAHFQASRPSPHSAAVTQPSPPLLKIPSSHNAPPPIPPQAAPKASQPTAPAPATHQAPRPSSQPTQTTLPPRAPIISGTAAAILALQTVSFDHRSAPAVVSTNSSYSGGGGGSEDCCCHGDHRVDGCVSVDASSSRASVSAIGGTGRSTSGNSPLAKGDAGPIVAGKTLDVGEGRWVHRGRDGVENDSSEKGSTNEAGTAVGNEHSARNFSSAPIAKSTYHRDPTVNAHGCSATVATRTSDIQSKASSSVIAATRPASSSAAASTTATTATSTTTSKKAFPSRYSDGAPIIAGTAAAQMAIATAARIAASRRDGCSGMTSSISSAVGAISMTMNMNMTTRDVTTGTSMSHAIAEMNHYNFSEDMSQFGSAMEKLSSVGKIANMDSQNRTNTSAMSTSTANVADSAYVVKSASSGNISAMTRKPTEARDESSSRGKTNGASIIHGKNRVTTTAVLSPPPTGKGVRSALLSKSTSCQSKKNTPTKALSWVDHAPRVTPEDFSANHRHSTSKRTPSVAPCEDSGSGSAASSVLARQLSNPSHPQQVPRVPSEQHRIPAAPTPSASMKQGALSSAPSPGGGMDILADIISHVPPMIVPASQRQSPSKSVPMACQSATAADSSRSPLHSSQQQRQTLHQSTRHYSTQFSPQHQQQQQQQQQQQLHHTLYSSGQPTSSKPMHYQIPTATHTTVTHRVSAIPSYQEIYQEMRQMEQSTSSHPQHSTDQRHYKPMEVDNPTPANISDATQQYYPSQPQHLQYHSQDPTSVREPPTTSSCTSYSVEEVPVPMQCVVETVEPPPPTKTTQRPPTTHFGHAEGGEIVEGKELYTRKDLAIAGGHALEHKDVHGNMKEGADSIIVSHLERDLREGDGLCWLLFSCDRTNGGGALCRSYHKKRAIRVFRSSLLGGRFSAPYLDEDEDDEIGYRYDGLYMVKAVWDVNGNETETFPTTGVEGWQTFFFTRLPKKPLDAKDVEPGMQYNQLGLQELWGSIQKMRGVKRPKKFEIPPVPAKLPPFKRVAITGENKDRKAMAYKPPPKPEPKQDDDQEMDRMIVSTKTSRNTCQSDSEESCDSSADEIPNKAEADKSKSETSHHHSQHTSQHSDNEKTSRRLSMSRPRMLCIPNPASQSNHRKRGEPHNDADSSDSDESSGRFQDHKKSPITKRQKSDEPLVNTKVSIPSKKPDVLVDSSSYFPKRTSAAKAEAANRNLLSKPKKPNNKRKSATPNSRKGGKKAKKALEEEEVDEYSSEEELVDQASLTVGSRVLVMYKGSLFKATIRKRREKNGRHDFLIHYDGNKKSNVHWVPIDRIPEIISLAVNVTTSKKTAPKRKGSSAKKTSVKRSSYEDDDSSDDENKENEMSPRESRFSDEVDKESKESRDFDGIVVAEENTSSSNKVSASIENKLEADNVDSIPRPEFVRTVECSESVNRVSPDESLSPKGNLTSIDSSTEQSKAEESTSHCNISRMSEIAPDQLSSNLNPPDFTRSTARTDICDAEPVENLTSAQLPLKTSPGESNENNLSSNSSEAASSEKRENESSGKSSTLSSIADDDEASADGAEGPSSNGSDHISKEVVKSQIDGVKFPVGCKVYVEYRHIFYSSTILKTRKKKAAHEYLVHYQGYKKASNRWVKEDTLHEVNEATTKRYEEQRLIPADILYGTDQTEFSMVTRRKKAAEESNSSPSKLKHRGSRIDISELADLGDIEPGVAFLPGSVVFVEWSGALYLAKMLKKRFSGDRMEYMVSYDGYESDFDAWVSIHKIYEVDHQSKKVFKRLKSDMLPQPPPGPKRETRSSLEAETLAAPTPKRESRRKKEDDIVSDFDMSSKANGEVRQVESQIDMQGIPSGVEFLPGSTLFAERNRGLCLAKMLKKRGKGDYMEYFIQYMGLKKEETRWISTALVFEINPQTKRMYRLYSGKKKS